MAFKLPIKLQEVAGVHRPSSVPPGCRLGGAMQKTGKVQAVSDLAQEYDFAIIDGKPLPAFRIDEG
jgi:hypothetical protein